MPRIKKSNKVFQCRQCGNNCIVGMVKNDSIPNNCLYKDATITPQWEEVCQE